MRLLRVDREVINMNLAWLLASGALVAVALQNAVVVVDNQVCVTGSYGQPRNRHDSRGLRGSIH